MAVRLHPHAQARLIERGAAQDDVITAVKHGEMFPAKFGRFGFRSNFQYNDRWRGKVSAAKQVEAIAVREGDD